jgi:large-conductance mechanosensitive channel
VSGNQPQFFTAAVLSFPWDRFFDQGERVFEVVFFVLWLAFVIFLACSAVRFLRENAKNKAKSRKKRRDRPSTSVVR